MYLKSCERLCGSDEEIIHQWMQARRTYVRAFFSAPSMEKCRFFSKYLFRPMFKVPLGITCSNNGLFVFVCTGYHLLRSVSTKFALELL